MAQKILIIDDEMVIHNALQRMLSPRYEVIHAMNGVEGLQKAIAESPDLVLLDITMPEKDGRAVLQELRARPDTETLPVIMLTASGQVMDKVAGFEMGANDYITKPFDMAVLLARVDAALKSA